MGEANLKKIPVSVRSSKPKKQHTPIAALRMIPEHFLLTAPQYPQDPALQVKLTVGLRDWEFFLRLYESTDDISFSQPLLLDDPPEDLVTDPAACLKVSFLFEKLTGFSFQVPHDSEGVISIVPRSVFLEMLVPLSAQKRDDIRALTHAPFSEIIVAVDDESSFIFVSEPMVSGFH